jgi:hypothetical protein
MFSPLRMCIAGLYGTSDSLLTRPQHDDRDAFAGLHDNTVTSLTMAVPRLLA